jgi:putative membrane protein
MPRILTLAALAVALATPAARAQQTAGNAPVNDALFAEAAADSGLAEVTLSEIGFRKATDPELKKFSQQMMDDHSRLNSELTTLAARKQLALPRMVDARARFCAQSLSGLSGEMFDRCYAKAQWNAHMEAVATFEAEAERGQDADLRAFASRALPRLKEHLKMIKPIAMKYEKDDRSESGK